MTVAEPPLTVAVHTLDSGRREALIADVRTGLGARPKHLSPRWFYDERGSRLFDAITQLPEYYQTRTETAILTDRVEEIIASTRPDTIVEIGAGSCAKSRVLLGAGRREGSLRRFVPFDVSEPTLQQSARRLVAEFPGLHVYAVVGDLQAHLAAIPRFGRQLVVFLGSTIGNLDGGQRGRFLGAARSLLADGDALLLGVDLVKPTADLIAAYDDSRGLTAEFNRNILAVLNAELGSRFDPAAFDHVVRYDEGFHHVEMHLRARTAMSVDIPAAGMRVELEEGETVRTEISAKFTREQVDGDLEAAGMRLAAWHTDPAARFAVAVAVPAAR